MSSYKIMYVINEDEYNKYKELQADKPTSEECSTCHKKFETAELLAQHVKMEHYKGLKCNICERTGFKNEAALKRHIRSIHKHKQVVREPKKFILSKSKWLTI